MIDNKVTKRNQSKTTAKRASFSEDTNPQNKPSETPQKDSSLEKNEYRKERFSKRVFQTRTSLLDDHFDTSQLNNSLFKGFFHMLLIMSFVYVISHIILNGIKTGSLLSLKIINTFKTDFFMAISTWPLFYAWSFIAFFLQKLVLKGLPMWLLFILQHFSQTGIFIFTLWIVIHRNWGVSHTIFVVFQAIVHFMKMHAYTISNRDLREQWIHLKSQGKASSDHSYPQNVNLEDFNYFLWAPTLAYEVKYPKKENINYFYILRKWIYCVFQLLLLYIIASDHIMPIVELGTKISHLEAISRMLIPVTVMFIVLFTLVFENMLNIFGELTKFGDRQFYQDWWNATTFDEFNGKWSRPVHDFFFRYIYLEAINRYKFRKGFAKFLSYFFSAALHEMCLSLVFKKVKPILFVFILIQIPSMIIGKYLKGTIIGNILLWVALLLGIPLIIILYIRDEENIMRFMQI